MAPDKAVFEFWDDLFETNAPAAETIARWVCEILIGADDAVTMAHERIAALPAIDAVRVSVAVDGLKVEVALGCNSASQKVAVKGSRLFAPGIRSGFSPAWAQANPIGKFFALNVAVHSAEVDDVLNFAVSNVLDFAVSKVSARILAAVRERLADGRWLVSGVSASDLTGARIDLAVARARDARIDILSAQASWPPPVRDALVDVEIRRAPVEAPPPPRTQSFAAEDDKLVEEMRRLISEGKAESAIAAAKLVAPKARRTKVRTGRNGENLDSVIERLRRRYGVKYPSYTRM